MFDDLGTDVPDWAARTIARLVELDSQWRAYISAVEDIRRRQNENSEASKAIGKLPKEQQAEARAPLLAEGRALRDAEREQTAAASVAEAARDEAWVRLPNLTHDATPARRHR